MRRRLQGLLFVVAPALVAGVRVGLFLTFFFRRVVLVMFVLLAFILLQKGLLKLSQMRLSRAA